MPASPPEETKWKPGQSGNPNGRPKGIARRARELVGNDPQALLEVLLAVARDDKAKPTERVQAAQAYLDRAWGKSASYAPVEDGDPLELSEIDREIADIVDELAARRKAPSTDASTNGALEANGKAGAAPA